jgi:hypothetical protein
VITDGTPLCGDPKFRLPEREEALPGDGVPGRRRALLALAQERSHLGTGMHAFVVKPSLYCNITFSFCCHWRRAMCVVRVEGSFLSRGDGAGDLVPALHGQ